MTKKLDELTIARMRFAYVSRECASFDDIARKFRISRSSVSRYAAAGGWTALRNSTEQIQSSAIADHVHSSVSLSGAVVDFDDFLTTAIQDLANAGKATDAKSKEGVLSVMLKALELHRKYHPLTMSELADLALSTPNFNPQEFAKLVREKSDQLTG
jgi:hypothetical protein